MNDSALEQKIVNLQAQIVTLLDKDTQWGIRWQQQFNRAEQLSRRLASTEAELNVAVDKLEAAATRVEYLEQDRTELRRHLEAARITDAEVDRLYGSRAASR